MNSLKAIAAAISYESQRHIDALETGEEVLVQETRRWDDSIGATFSMRGKEDATDYRYCPDPDIMPVFIDDEWIDAVRSNLPETAQDKFIRLTQKLGLPEYDSEIITRSKNLSTIFDETLQYYNNPKEVANWIIVELLSIAKGDNKGEDDVRIDCQKFAKLIELVDGRTINRNVGKNTLPYSGGGYRPSGVCREEQAGNDQRYKPYQQHHTGSSVGKPQRPLRNIRREQKVHGFSLVKS